MDAWGTAMSSCHPLCRPACLAPLATQAKPWCWQIAPIPGWWWPRDAGTGCRDLQSGPSPPAWGVQVKPMPGKQNIAALCSLCHERMGQRKSSPALLVSSDSNPFSFLSFLSLHEGKKHLPGDAGLGGQGSGTSCIAPGPFCNQFGIELEQCVVSWTCISWATSRSSL